MATGITPLTRSIPPRLISNVISSRSLTSLRAPNRLAHPALITAGLQSLSKLKFYCEVLGGAVVMEAGWHLENRDWPRGAHLDIQLFDGEGHMNAYWQPWGQPAPDQMFPHRAFRIKSPEKLDELIGRLDAFSVPYILATPETAAVGTPVPVSIYLRDPDGNQLELRCAAYPFRSDMHVGAFDPTTQYYPWREWRALVPDGGGRRSGRASDAPRESPRSPAVRSRSP